MSTQQSHVTASAEEPTCGCHPAFHELGVHAPVGDARPHNP